MFDEVVVSLRLRGANAPYQNLHVALAALVNPRKTTVSTPYGSSPDQAEGILRRVEIRVAARLSEALIDSKEESLDNTERLRRRILSEAQAVVDEAMRQWQYGSEYQVEIVIASLYWTDASVGRLQAQHRGWW